MFSCVTTLAGTALGTFVGLVPERLREICFFTSFLDRYKAWWLWL